MKIEDFEFIVEEDSSLTKEEIYESETIINRIGLTGEFNHNHLATINGEDVILKLDKEDLGNILTILIKENSHLTNFRIEYLGSEEYVDVGTDGIGCLIVSVARDVEVLKIEGMNFLFW